MKNRLIALLLALATVAGAYAAKSDVIEFNIVGGGTTVSDAAKRSMEDNLVSLLTMMSRARANNSNSLNFSGIRITDSAKSTILQMWKFQPLQVWDDDGEAPAVDENLLNIAAVKSYQVRNIPVRIFPRETPGKDMYREVAVNFASDGTITDFNITMERQQYNDIIQGGVTVQDVENRKMLAYWMDQLKMAYESKDLAYLKQLFDKDAVIITGVRANKSTGKAAEFRDKEKFDYFVKTREQYMSSMDRVFKNNREIHVNFKDQEYGCNELMTVTDRNGEDMPRYYMVWCTQEWNATRYADVGRLFVLWDFKNPEAPVIMVRAWTHPDDPKQFSDEDFRLNTN